MADDTATPPTNTPDPKAAAPGTLPVEKNVEIPVKEPKGLDAKEKAELLDEIHKLRERSRKAETERDSNKAALDKIEADKLAEQGKFKEMYEKAEKEKADLSQKLRENLVQAELRLRTMQAGIIDPDAANMIKIPKDLMEGDLGDVSDKITALVEKHKAEKPKWYADKTDPTPKPKPTTGGSTTTPAPGTVDKDMDVTKMNPKDYQAAKSKMLSDMRRNRRY